jgi:hypothetical protein
MGKATATDVEPKADNNKARLMVAKIKYLDIVKY